MILYLIITDISESVLELKALEGVLVSDLKLLSYLSNPVLMRTSSIHCEMVMMVSATTSALNPV